MTRISAFFATLVGVVCLYPFLAAAQVQERLSAPAPAAADPCTEGMRSLSALCTCPPNTHLDANGHCAVDLVSPPPISSKVVCTGGKVTDGSCVCPAGFMVMPMNAETNGGTCVKTDAENCLGGELTVSGTCLCNGQVVMSGETYLLEYTNGKCVPKRCPVQTQWREGRCVAISAISPNPEPEAKPKPAQSHEPRERTEEPEHHRPCGRGMIRTQSGGCVAMHRREPGISPRTPPDVSVVPAVPAVPPSELRQLYREHHLPGNPQQN
jgi:hypothetical protein